MKNKVLFISGILTIVLLFTKCSDEWLEEETPHLITTGSLYTNLEGFENGLNGLYVLVRQEKEGESNGATGGFNQVRYELMANSSDNMQTIMRDRWARVALYWGDLMNPQLGHIEQCFTWLYRIVNTANTIINQAETKTDIDWSGGSASREENKSRVIAEAKAIRAWAYRHLSFLFGDVPLSLEESLGSNIRTDWERAPVAQVRKQIIDDFLFAEKSIPVEPIMPGRITKGAVQHYLAEMYLTIGKPDSALFWADKVVNTSGYQLVTERYGVHASEPGTPFTDMFLDGNANRNEGNTESLWTWQWGYINGGGANIMRRWYGSEYYRISIDGVTPLQITVDRGGRSQGRFGFTKFAIDLYEPQDDRGSEYAIRKFFILKDEKQNDTGVPDNLPPGYQYGDTIWMQWDEDVVLDPSSVRRAWPYVRKFDAADPTSIRGAASNKNLPYLRLAETYLLKAEAELMLGHPDLAANTINVVRRRANASDITAGDVDIDFILDERSRELLIEEHRRYTLLRTGKWLERTRLHNNNGGQAITERDKLFPIPQVVIDANLTATMEQNPGY